MPRLIIVGSSCAGKTTLAKQLSRELGVHHIHLDALNWLPDWVERDKESFLQLLQEEVTSHEDWVIDGNYSRTHHITWSRADAVIWLNYSYPVVLWRALSRTVRRVFSKEKLYSGNVETFRKAFLSHDSILLWVITTFHSRRRKYRATRAGKKYPHLEWIELRRPREADGLLDSLRNAYPGTSSPEN